MTSKFARAAWLAAAAAACPAVPAAADEASDLAAIHKQLDSIRHDYESKIKSLELRLAKAERVAKAAQTAAQAASRVASKTPAPSETVQSPAEALPPPAQDVAEAAPEPPPPAAPPASNNAFNPGIAAVLNGFYAAASRDTADARIRGFAIGDEAGLPPRGFSLGESEISLAANIDPELAGFLDISFDRENNPNIEEAYITTKNLPGGFTVKAGRFLSGIGYINERHAHDWSFSDAPLPYRAFLNSQYGDDGLQVRWLAPTDIFLEFGAELFRGDSYPASGAAHAGVGTATAFVHTGDDINESSSWLAALSYLHTRAENRETENTLFTGTDTFTGNDDLGFLSLVYKWAPGGNPTVRNLVLAGEAFLGREKGAFDAAPVSQTRSGFYVQGVYQFMPQWSVGLRYAQVNASGVGPLLAGTALDDFGHTPRAETALLEYDTSEFGRLRLQYTHDQSDLKANDELMLQYTVIYGPHGAHRY